MTTKSDFIWRRHPEDHTAASAVLGWDGRIDNRDDLLLRLEDAVSTDTSDPGIVLAAYARWGIAGLVQVIGDWSVVVRESGNRAIILASDFAGTRPLYYQRQPDRLVWSTRLASLLETNTHTIDEEYVRAYLMVGGHPTHTPYAGVYLVPPGQAIRITTTGSSVHPFWSLPTGDVVHYRDERRYEEQLRALFQEAVAVRLQTDGHVVAELSGGVDSSSVVCMAQHLIRTGAVAARQLTTVSYEHRGSLDSRFIREVEGFCGVNGVHLSTHLTPIVSEAEIGHALPETSTPLQRSAAGVAHRLGAKVFLTGQNGDLVMGNWLDDSLQVAASLRHGRIGQALKETLAWSKALKVPAAWILSRAVQATLPSMLSPRATYSSEEWSTSGAPEMSLQPRFHKGAGPDKHDGFLTTDWMHARPERRKHFLALTTMRELRPFQGLEPMRDLDYTHPFVHRPLLEFMMSVPAAVLCRPNEPRRLMRRALADLWPPMLRKRRSKSLFGAPLIEALKPLALNLLKADQWQVVERGWIDRASFAIRLEKLTHGLDCNEPQLRRIILLEYWLHRRDHSQQSRAVLQAS